MGWGERPWPQSLGWVPRKTACWYRVAAGTEAREWRSPPPQSLGVRVPVWSRLLPKVPKSGSSGSRRHEAIRGGTRPFRERSKLSFSLQEAAGALYAQARTAADRFWSFGCYKRDAGWGVGGDRNRPLGLLSSFSQKLARCRGALRCGRTGVWRAEQNQSHLSAPAERRRLGKLEVPKLPVETAGTPGFQDRV